VDGFAGYSVVRGRIIEVADFAAEKGAHLSDGFSLAAKKTGGRVIMDFGKRKETIELEPGSVIVFSREADFVLSPLKLSEKAGSGGNGTAARPRGPIAPRPSRHLLEYVLDILKAVDESRFTEAEVRIEELAELFPTEEAVYSYTEILKAKLEEARKRAPDTAPPRFATDGPAGKKKRVAELKKQGLDFYSRGKLKEAVECWKKVLELEPADEEAKRYLKRAETVSKKL